VDSVVWRAASLLLSFPDQRFYDRRPMLRAAVADLQAGAERRCLDAFLDHVDRTAPMRLVVHYQEMSLGGRLNLTYYRDMDADRRHYARARLAELYAAADCDAEEEPADSLPAVLEYAALCRDDWLLREHQVALERLHATLEADGTPYAILVEAVRATLVPPRAALAPPRVTLVPPRAALVSPRAVPRFPVPFRRTAQATFSDEPVEEEDEELAEPVEDESDFDEESDLPESLDDEESDEDADGEVEALDFPLPELRLSVR
jgi:nitrate reductase assembly molybdenum cofactor insertion protein NarJ